MDNNICSYIVKGLFDQQMKINKRQKLINMLLVGYSVLLTLNISELNKEILKMKQTTKVVEPKPIIPAKAKKAKGE